MRSQSYLYYFCALSFLLTIPVVSAQSAQEDKVEIYEVVVTGRQPGPPLWKVSNGDNVMYIFPYISPVIKNLDWETEKVQNAIAETQEILERPQIAARTSPLTMLNPINLIRGYRLARRLTRNPDNATLKEVLPADVYTRYEAVKQTYFPREKDFEKLRPFIVGWRMENRVHDKEGLESADDIEKTLRRLLRRNRNLTFTPIEVEMEVRGSFRELADRAENLIDSLDPADELACFETTLRQMERDIENRKDRADLWARGYIDEFRMIPLDGTNEDPCFVLITGSSEKDNIAQMQQQLNDLWLAEAERALTENRGTFAILEVSDLLRPDGPIAILKEKGYTVVEP